MDDKRKLFAICISALVVGSAGMWVSIASIVRFVVAVGPQGPKGDQGDQGIGAVGLVSVGFLDPDDNDIIRGDYQIKALIGGTYNYTLQLLCNGSLLSTTIPYMWDSSLVTDGWWNLTLKVKDLDTNNTGFDTIFVYTLNHGQIEWIFGDCSHGDTLNGVFNCTTEISVTSWYFLEFNFYFTDPDSFNDLNMSVYCVFERYNGTDYEYWDQTGSRYVFHRGSNYDDYHQASTSWLKKIESGTFRIWVCVTNGILRRGAALYMSIFY